jgi:hypothetical protein
MFATSLKEFREDYHLWIISHLVDKKSLYSHSRIQARLSVVGQNQAAIAP